MALPFNISGTVLDTDSSTPVANATVYARNETTNEATTVTTDGNGQYVLDIANLTSGYTVGDVVTVFVRFESAEAASSITVTTGGTTVNLTLSAITVGSLRYFAVQDFYDYFHFIEPTNTDTGVPTPAEVQKIGLGVEAEIDQKLGERFDDNGGSNYTTTQELHDSKSLQKDFFILNTPIVSMTTFQVNKASEGTAANWTTLTEANNEIELDLTTGRVRITSESNYPEPGAGQIRATYTSGRTVPNDIRKLAILMTARDLVQSSVGKALITGRDEFNPDAINVFDTQINTIMQSRYKGTILRTG